TLPYPIYFEFTLWPFYTLFAAYAISELAKRLHARLGPIGLYAWAAKQFAIGRQPPWQYVGRWILIGVILCILLASNPFVIRPNDLYRPPRDTAITRELHAASGIAPNAAFRGYTANLTGFNGPGGAPTDWLAILPGDNEAILAFGNTHRLPYLWRHDVAT